MSNEVAPTVDTFVENSNGEYKLRPGRSDYVTAADKNGSPYDLAKLQSMVVKCSSGNVHRFNYMVRVVNGALCQCINTNDQGSFAECLSTY